RRREVPRPHRLRPRFALGDRRPDRGERNSPGRARRGFARARALRCGGLRGTGEIRQDPCPLGELEDRLAPVILRSEATMKTFGGRITWLGHAAFVIESPGGARVAIDPWIGNNPSFPKGFDYGRLDVIA